MGFFDTVRNFFSSCQKAVAPGMFAFFSQSAIPQMTEKEYLKAYLGWVYACTSAIAERLADSEMKRQIKGKTGFLEAMGTD